MSENKKVDCWERFFGLTLNINPIFNLIGIIVISIKRRNRFKKIYSDSINIYFWLALAVSGIVSIIISYNKPLALLSFFVPFLFVWFYVMGRWYIDNPVRFLEDVIKGTAILGLLAIFFYITKIDLVINDVVLIKGTDNRGFILGIGDNGLGVLLQVGVIGALGMLVIETKRKKILENIIYFILSIGGLVISNSRGAMVGSVAGIIFLTLVISWKIIALFGGASIISLLLSSRFMNRVKSIFQYQNSNRFNIWKGSLKLIRDHLWFGTGPGNFAEVYEKYRVLEEHEHVLTPHNNYLNIISGWGIIGGLIFYGWIFFIMIRSWYRGANKYQIIILAILISFWIHVLFNDLAFPYVGILLGCLDNKRMKDKV
ncbi:MAG: O-antigen ligase family protein [Halanaerobiaceae bacterium]